MATGDRIDPGPGWRLLEVGERKPEGYEWRNIFERWITGVNIGEKLVPGMDPCRVRIPAPSSVKGIATRATVRVVMHDGRVVSRTERNDCGLGPTEFKGAMDAWRLAPLYKAKYIMLEIQRGENDF